MRVKSIYINASSSAGSVTLLDGGSSGTSKIVLDTPASATDNPVYVNIPGEGVLFKTNVYATLANVTSITVFFG
jgi:hypothetical protein